MTTLIKSALVIFFCLISLASVSFADYIEQVEEITAGNFFGYGARQMAMGGAGIMAIDGAALFYNPANLARIPRIESASFILYPRYLSTIRLSALNSSKSSKINTRINSAIVTIPYPTYRGSMVIGIGMVRGVSFDKLFRLNHIDTSLAGDIEALADEFQSGGLTQWGVGVGIDLSPRIAFGGAFYLYTGSHDYNWEYSLDSLDVLSYEADNLIVDKYLGYNMKLALSMRLNHIVALGIAVETPVIFNVEEEANIYEMIDGAVITDEYIYSEWEVKKPYVFSGGISAQFNNSILTADFDYTDWSQLKYDDNVEMEKENINIRSYYKDVLRFRLGGEHVFPKSGFSIRAGYFNDPIPLVSDFVNNNRSGITFGAGILIDQVMTIDVAYVHGSYKRNSDLVYSTVVDTEDNLLSSHNLIVDEDISYNRIFLTAAYRF